MSQFILIKFKDNYADEFDIEGMWVTTISKWEQYKKSLSNIKFPMWIYFGTNEGIEYSSIEHYLKCCSYYPISEDEYYTMRNRLGEFFGYFLYAHPNDEDEYENWS